MEILFQSVRSIVVLSSYHAPSNSEISGGRSCCSLSPRSKHRGSTLCYAAQPLKALHKPSIHAAQLGFGLCGPHARHTKLGWDQLLLPTSRTLRNNATIKSTNRLGWFKQTTMWGYQAPGWPQQVDERLKGSLGTSVQPTTGHGG